MSIAPDLIWPSSLAWHSPWGGPQWA